VSPMLCGFRTGLTAVIACCCCDCVRSQGEWASMGVLSSGQYGQPKDIIYSFPCVCKNGQWKVVRALTVSPISVLLREIALLALRQPGRVSSVRQVEGLKIDEFSRKLMKATADELLEEKKQALGK
jgi:hypothetical protein